MEKQEILQNLRAKLINFSFWSDLEYEALLNLDDYGVENETIDSYLASYLLDKISCYSRINLMFDEKEINYIASLATTDDEIKCMEEVMEIVSLSTDLYDIASYELEKHPVILYHETIYDCLCSESEFLEYAIYCNESNMKLNNLDILFSIISLHQQETEYNSLMEITSAIKILLKQNNIEKILDKLCEYFSKKIECESGGDYKLLMIGSEIIKQLYESSNNSCLYMLAENRYLCNASYRLECTKNMSLSQEYIKKAKKMK